MESFFVIIMVLVSNTLIFTVLSHYLLVIIILHTMFIFIHLHTYDNFNIKVFFCLYAIKNVFQTVMSERNNTKLTKS